MTSPWKDPGSGPRRRQSSRRKRNESDDREHRRSEAYRSDDDLSLYISDRRSSREMIDRESDDF